MCKRIIKLNEDKIIYMNKEFNITMIELKSNEQFDDNNYLELDENLFIDNSELIYEDKPLYIFDYSKKDEPVSVLYGSLNKIVGYNLIHNCEVHPKECLF